MYFLLVEWSELGQIIPYARYFLREVKFAVSAVRLATTNFWSSKISIRRQ